MTGVSLEAVRRVLSAAAIAGLLVSATVVGGVLAPGSAMAQDYRDMSCGELWYERNAIYARRGYCFETRRARRVFGRRCYPPFGRLRPYERREIRRIKRWERRKGC